MRCTSCSEAVKPVIAIDIDGTLGDYHGHFHRFLLEYYDLTLSKKMTFEGPGEYSDWCQDQHGLTKEEYRQAKLAYRQGGLKRTMPTFVGARQFVDRLRWLGFEVWICTTRPYMRLDNIDPDTREWMRRNGIKSDYVIYGEEKYRQLVRRVDPTRVVAVVEDLPEMCSHAIEVGLAPVQIERDHNRKAQGPIGTTRVWDYDSAYHHISERLNAWTKR